MKNLFKSGTKKKDFPVELVNDMLNLKQTLKNKSLENKIFWVDKNSTNAEVRRAVK